MHDTDKFDFNIKALIGAFLELKDKCYFLEKHFLGEGFFNINNNKFDFVYIHSFYSTFRDVCDLPIFFLINEEISNSHCRDLFPDLLQSIFTHHYTALDKLQASDKLLNYKHTDEELQDLLKNRFNQIEGSLMLDFDVSAFSVFENYISKLYNAFCRTHKEKNADETKAKIKYLIDNINDDNRLDTINKIIKSQGVFTSFQDKFNAIHRIGERYARDIKKDREIINFLSKLRNTVHNNGIHLGCDTKIKFNEKDFELKQGEPFFVTSYVESLKLIGELIEIYTAILSSIADRGEHIESFIELKKTNKFKILNDISNEFISSGHENYDEFIDFLVVKKLFTEIQARGIVDVLKNVKEPLDEGGFLKFIGQDFTSI